MADDWRYSPQIFLTKTIEAARAIILTPEAGLSPEERWEKETRWLFSEGRMPFDGGMTLDYGTGIGRLAKQIGGPVLGVDISPTMRAMAETQVGRPDFVTCSPPGLTVLAQAGLRCKGAYAVWVLQHCLDVEWDIRSIARMLEPGAPFVVVNRKERVVPLQDSAGKQAWWDDGIDIDVILRHFFTHEVGEPMPEHLCAPGAFYTLWRRNEAAVDMAEARLVHVRQRAGQP